MPFLCVLIIIVDVQKFDGDSTIVYSIEEDDEDILTMTAIIGDILSLSKIVLDFLLLTLNVIFPKNLKIFSPGEVVAWRVFRRRTNGGLKEAVHQDRKASCVF